MEPHAGHPHPAVNPGVGPAATPDKDSPSSGTESGPVKEQLAQFPSTGTQIPMQVKMKDERNLSFAIRGVWPGNFFSARGDFLGGR